jgi:alpha-ketoglutarate-dependent taurine dioxygenase
VEFPQLIEPARAGTDLRSWVADNASEVDDILAHRGAVLFRAFAVDGPDGFRSAVKPMLGQPMSYIEGASPRVSRGAGVYTSTEYPADITVALHNELSYSHQWPARVAFYCRHPAGEGGATPIADSRKVYQRLAGSRAAAALRTSGVRYTRQMQRRRGPGVCWPVVFATEDEAEVEEYCNQAGIEFEWRPDGALRTSQVRPAALRHPVTNEPVWFNQAHQWHPSNAGPEGEAVLREIFADALPMNASFGDGTEIGPEVLAEVRAAYDAHYTAFAWQAGDLMVLDNMLTAHGRAPFSGSREVLVSMGHPLRLCDIDRA